MQTEIHTDPPTETLCGLLAEDGVDEIVASVLDAADVEILEDLGGGPTGAAGPDGRPVIGVRKRHPVERSCRRQRILTEPVAVRGIIRGRRIVRAGIDKERKGEKHEVHGEQGAQ